MRSPRSLLAGSIFAAFVDDDSVGRCGERCDPTHTLGKRDEESVGGGYEVCRGGDRGRMM